MEILSRKRCIIGEGPIWNAKERVAYIMNGLENEICKIDISSGELSVIHTQKLVAAIGFDKENRMIASCLDGVYYIDGDEMIPLYDTEKYSISGGNDMKVGPDGRIYIGTQCEKRRGLSDKVDGKLYSIDKDGNVRTLLDGLILSNGMEWSMDEKRFYHTDSATHIIKEYSFDKVTGDIEFTGRSVYVRGVDGFTIDKNDLLHVACWGQKHIAVVDTRDMEIIDYIDTPATAPASCAFVGEDMSHLLVVSANYNDAYLQDEYAGFTFKKKMSVGGRTPYLFG